MQLKKTRCTSNASSGNNTNEKAVGKKCDVMSRRKVCGLLQTQEDAADTESRLHLDLLSGRQVTPECSEAQIHNTAFETVAASRPGGRGLAPQPLPGERKTEVSCWG